MKTSEELSIVVAEIDQIIRQGLWFDFHIYKYEGRKLTVAGSDDLLYYHTLEIIFEDVFFVSGFFNGWHSDTSSTVFCLPDNKIELNIKFEIEKGYHLFLFRTEDYSNDVVIAATDLSYKQETVLYYDK